MLMYLLAVVACLLLLAVVACFAAVVALRSSSNHLKGLPLTIDD